MFLRSQHYFLCLLQSQVFLEFWQLYHLLAILELYIAIDQLLVLTGRIYQLCRNHCFIQFICNLGKYSQFG